MISIYRLVCSTSKWEQFTQSAAKPSSVKPSEDKRPTWMDKSGLSILGIKLVYHTSKIYITFIYWEE